MSSAKLQYNTGYLKTILIMFFTAFLILASCNHIYADDLGFIASACKVYKEFSPILSFIILIVVVTTALAALFGKLSMAVVVTVMVTAVVIQKAPTVVRIITQQDLNTCEANAPAASGKQGD